MTTSPSSWRLNLPSPASSLREDADGDCTCSTAGSPTSSVVPPSTTTEPTLSLPKQEASPVRRRIGASLARPPWLSLLSGKRRVVQACSRVFDRCHARHRRRVREDRRGTGRRVDQRRPDRKSVV